jgi:CTP:molybdopterin cytidylyltransferase MocA
LTVTGVLLAAGAGRRYGGPKALVRDGDGTAWVRRRAETLLDGGCSRVLVVTGAQFRAVDAELEGLEVDTVRAAGWEEGMGASLRTGLVAAAADALMEAVLVALVDTPGLTPQVVGRLVERSSNDVLARAAYDGTPGHPVLIGERRLRAVVASAVGDRGARDYLHRHAVELVECADVGSGEDVDEPVPGRPTLGS